MIYLPKFRLLQQRTCTLLISLLTSANHGMTYLIALRVRKIVPGFDLNRSSWSGKDHPFGRTSTRHWTCTRSVLYQSRCMLRSMLLTKCGVRRRKRSKNQQLLQLKKKSCREFLQFGTWLHSTVKDESETKTENSLWNYHILMLLPCYKKNSVHDAFWLHEMIRLSNATQEI